MAESLIVDANTGGNTTPREQHPIGQHIGVCVDLIDLGERLEDFPGRPKAVKRKIAFVFQTGEAYKEEGDMQGRMMELSKEYTLSMHEKASLRKMIGTWRGSPLTDKELAGSLDLATMVGKTAILGLVGKTNSKGTTYTNIDTVTPLFPGLSVPELPGYTRSAFWEKRIAEYKAEVDEFKRTGATSAAPPKVITPPKLTEAEENAVMNKAFAAVEKESDDLIPF